MFHESDLNGQVMFLNDMDLMGFDESEEYQIMKTNKMIIKKRKALANKPILVKVGKHWINPYEVIRITHVQKVEDDMELGMKDLYAVQLRNDVKTVWLSEDEMMSLLRYFEVK